VTLALNLGFEKKEANLFEGKRSEEEGGSTYFSIQEKTEFKTETRNCFARLRSADMSCSESDGGDKQDEPAKFTHRYIPVFRDTSEKLREVLYSKL
jgi:hypothetical protein